MPPHIMVPLESSCPAAWEDTPAAIQRLVVDRNPT